MINKNLAEVLNHLRKLYEICQFQLKNYEKIIFDTENISIMILKLGEESNIALFFQKEEVESLKISAIRRYLTKIEELIDMDKKEIELQVILKKEEELMNLLDIKKQVQEKINHLKEKKDEINQDEFNFFLNEKEIRNSQIDQLNDEISELKNKIQRTNNAYIN